jgi:pyruvate/2-oxoglutarate dehydrogenase complex dihydrolipoamide acyltransferase (E2) component
MKKMIAIVAAAFFPMLAAAAAAHGQEVRLNTMGGQVFVTMPVETRALKGAPYSAEVVTDNTQTLADGNRIVQHSSGHVYRDSQGRVRREEDRPSGSPAISIVDPVAGISYSLDPDNRIAWKSATPAAEEIMKKLKAAKEEEARKREMEAAAKEGAPVSEELQGRREKERKADAEKMAAQVGGGRIARRRVEEQHSEEQLPAQQLAGVRVEGRRTTTTIVAGAIGNELPIIIVSEEWVSPELQVLVMTQRKDPRNGDSTYRLLNVVRREPDPSLFQVPADYTVKETGIRRLEPERQER